MNIILNTTCGKIKGNDRKTCYEFLGIRYAKAKRFESAKIIDSWDNIYDATAFGPCCEQARTYFQNLSIPERYFYYREFREGQEFTYSEDCLNLNIYTPCDIDKDTQKYPVLVFIHGGGFNSMANCEGYLDGEGYVARDVILVTINYRVGVLGYMTHEEIYKSEKHDGNLGLGDQILALNWIKKNISSFGGNSEQITVMGQSAGAISVQDLCLSDKCKNLFCGAIMMSGAGNWPDFAAPRDYLKTRDYWKTVMELSGAKSFDEFKTMPVKEVLRGVEEAKKVRKDGMFCTMPVVDGYYLKDKVKTLIKNPMSIPYMVGVTNNDMYTWILSNMAKKFTRKNNAYMYYFDVDAPGVDNNQAFHSSDLRYMFGTLDKSFREYTKEDYEISNIMMDYVASFVKTGNPNSDGLPVWEAGKPAMQFSKLGVKMNALNEWKLFKNTFKGDPK